MGDRQIITNLQALRAFAALGVVFTHTGVDIAGVHTDFQGVAMFFVISGFIIPSIRYRNVGAFCWHRLVRLAPIYWLATLAFVVWVWFPPPIEAQTWILAGVALCGLLPGAWLIGCVRHSWATQAVFLGLVAALLYAFGWPYLEPLYGKLSEPSQGYVWTSLLFLPNEVDPHGFPLNRVGWTLNLEMLFYATFAIALLFGRRWAPLLAAVALMAFKVFVDLGGCADFYCRVYADDYLVFFAGGVGVYYLYEWAKTESALISRQQAAALAVTAAIVLLAANIALPALAMHATAAALRYVAPPLVVMAGLICHLAGLRLANRPLLLIGDASYVLYLSHVLVLNTFEQASKTLAWPAVTTAEGATIFVVVAILAAIAIHRFVELPLLAAMRSVKPLPGLRGAFRPLVSGPRMPRSAVRAPAIGA